MIKVCDAIMGSGKSSAAINYMNEHPDNKFIYITPYLDEVARIINSCPNLHFTEPKDNVPKYHFKKREHTAALIKQGRNISTTHQAFKNYTQEMLDNIRNFNYTLIIDEDVNVLESCGYNQNDVDLLVEAGYIKKENDTYVLNDKKYKGAIFEELFKTIESKELVKSDLCDEVTDISCFYWLLPRDLIDSFNEVYILTYLFKGQSLHHFLEIYHMPYKYIGVEKSDDGKFRFSPDRSYMPEYVKSLDSLIQTIDNDKLNNIGKNRCALSMNWYSSGGSKVKDLKNNMYNCVNNLWRGISADDKLWGGFKDFKDKIKSKGYTKSFLSFNTRATNEYKDRHYLMYVVNLFMNVGEKLFYKQNGIETDDDEYALSMMVQWIWRSAIREGEQIHIYIPSRRMRELLKEWINDTMEGGKHIELS